MNFEFSFCFGEIFHVHVFRGSTLEDVIKENGVSFYNFLMYLERDLHLDVNLITFNFMHGGITGSYGDYLFVLRKLS